MQRSELDLRPRRLEVEDPHENTAQVYSYEDRSNTLTRTLHTTDILGTVAARHGANNL